VKPLVDCLASLVLCVGVPLLNSALQPITPAVDGSQIVVGELAPLLFESSDELLPVPECDPNPSGLRCRIATRSRPAEFLIGLNLQFQACISKHTTARMQALLFHNPTAGTGSLTPEGLLSVLREAGFSADYCSTKDDYKSALEKSTDVIVVAGGDGALARVVRDLRHRTTPIAIWPLGTANNVARSLGIGGDPDEILDSLRKGSMQSVDVGLAIGPWGKRRFIEALGVGAFANSMQSTGPKPPAVDRPRIGRERLQEAVASAKPERWKLKIDGETLEGEFLMVEIANTSFFGPGLRFAPSAELSDQKLDVVYLRPEKRKEMFDWLAASKGEAPPLTVKRGRDISFKWDKSALHVDDRLWGPPKKPVAVKARMEATQLHVYVPARKGDAP